MMIKSRSWGSPVLIPYADSNGNQDREAYLVPDDAEPILIPDPISSPELYLYLLKM